MGEIYFETLLNWYSGLNSYFSLSHRLPLLGLLLNFVGIHPNIPISSYLKQSMWEVNFPTLSSQKISIFFPHTCKWFDTAFVWYRASLWLRCKESTSSAGDPGSVPGSGRSPGGGNGNPLQYPCLENPMDGGAWQAIQSMGLQRFGHDWVTSIFFCVILDFKVKGIFSLELGRFHLINFWLHSLFWRICTWWLRW